jgi:hypothetical protein
MGRLKLTAETIVAVGMIVVMVLAVAIMAGVARAVWGWQ